MKSIFSVIKNYFPKYLPSFYFYFLRKTNTFIKSKYSKNRQWSKSIVYFGLWFGVICGFVLTFYNYRFLFNLSLLWWIPAILGFIVFSGLFKKNLPHFNFNFINLFL